MFKNLVVAAMIITPLQAFAAENEAPADEEIVVFAPQRLIETTLDFRFNEKTGKLKSCKVKEGKKKSPIPDFWCGAAQTCLDAGARTQQAANDCISARLPEFIKAYRATHPRLETQRAK